RSAPFRLGLVDAVGLAGFAGLAHRSSPPLRLAPGSTHGMGLSFEFRLLAPRGPVALVVFGAPALRRRASRSARSNMALPGRLSKPPNHLMVPRRPAQIGSRMGACFTWRRVMSDPHHDSLSRSAQ